MKNSPAVYLGRVVNRHNFRTFVYGANNAKKLVNSWDEYELAMSSGLWFATSDELDVSRETFSEKPADVSRETCLSSNDEKKKIKRKYKSRKSNDTES